MKDIIRIHLANIPYDIETDARQTLTSYLGQIESYTNDSEIVSDVEARIVEVLAEKGISKNQIITKAVVDQVIEQLGAPESFSEDETIASVQTLATRKLYRDSGKAWLGGIAAGLASYYHVSSWWIRLLLLVSIPLTSGFSILLYILAWIVLPATKTNGDVLRLNGTSVTVQSINQLAKADAVVRPDRDRRILRVVSVITGIAIIAVLVMILAVVGLRTGIAASQGELTGFAVFNNLSGELQTLLITSAVVTLVTTVAATLLVAFLLITWRFKKPIVITAIIAAVLAIGATATGITGAVIAQRQLNDRVQQMVSTRSIPINDVDTDLSSLSIMNFGSGSVTYVMSTTERPHIEMTALKSDPNPTISHDTSNIGIVFGNEEKQIESMYSPTYTIYLRPFENVRTRGTVSIDGKSNTFATLNLTAYDNSLVTLTDMTVQSLGASLSPYASLDALQIAAKNVSLKNALYSNTQLGTVDTLDLSVSTVCGDQAIGTTSVDVQTINQTLTVNGATKALQDIKQVCYEIRFGTFDKY